MRNFIKNMGSKPNAMLSRQTREKLKDLSSSDRFKVIVEQKKIELEKKMILEKKNPAMKGQEMSKNAQKVIQAMAEEKAGKAIRKIENEIKMKFAIKAMRVNGGKIDDNGRIFNDAGKQVGQINVETGRIQSGWLSMGKFKPDSIWSKQKIERLIEKANQGPTTFTGHKLEAATTPGSSGFWGVGAPSGSDNSGSWW